MPETAKKESERIECLDTPDISAENVLSGENVSLSPVLLHDHQTAGIEWIWDRVEKRKGCILGDEMGLGKTLQILRVIDRFWKTRGKSVLVIVPTTLLRNWEAEIKKFAVDVPYLVVHAGSEVWCALQKADGNHVLLLTYETAQRKASLLKKASFDLLVVDEAQRIKNRDTQISNVCRAIDCPVKICITGTPVQNTLGELWTLIDTVRPKYLGDSNAFKVEYQDVLRRAKQKNASREDRLQGEAATQKLRMMLEDVILRRTKKEVLIKLPEKREYIVPCILSPAQKQAYKDTLRDDLMRATLLGKENPLVAITALRRICSGCTPKRDSRNHTAEEKEPNKQARSTGKEPESASQLGRNISEPSMLPKPLAVLRLLRKWKRRSEPRKVLVFSQFKDALDGISRRLRAAQIPHQRMDGCTPVGKRLEIIKEFGRAQGVEALLLTTKVGGVGLNITAANTVMLLDMDWNPFNDDQAKGRAHRLGQTQEVEVYKFICQGTIEDVIHSNQQIKKDISEGVLEGKRRKRLFDKIDLCRLFHFEG